MDSNKNPQLELAYNYVCNTGKNIFLTGKAGTGKTTFLHRIKAEAVKRMVVVAPTGVAAINAGGMTIHSFFQLPFGPQLPDKSPKEARPHRFAKKKISLIKSLDLLVIDEISMVRADLLDGIDGVLRRYRNHAQPFGGVQLLMIGDLNQLPPVVKPDEWSMLHKYYQTPYFFGSLALQKSGPVTIELKHIYRQSDERFISLLNKVRDNQLDQEVLAALNSRYRADFQPQEKDGYITLTSHNAVAKRINQERLATLPGDIQRFEADITGDFPAHAYPTDELLELKHGAQVMFVKNDPSPEKFFYNGKIGQVLSFEEESIVVKCPDDPEAIHVSALGWQNVKYKLNEGTKEVEEQIAGTFTQYPLKLAWAITIHKSQGLTLERAIIDAQAAFAHGQVYVALSRCKSFEGIVLRSKISYGSVKTDSVVQQYNEEAERNAPDEATLAHSKKAYQQKLILELFDYKPVKRAIGFFERSLLEHPGAFQDSVLDYLSELSGKADAALFTVAKNFRPQLQSFLAQPGLPEENAGLEARIQKASLYFLEKQNEEIWPQVEGIKLLSDNQAAIKKATEKLTRLKEAFIVKKACLVACKGGFSTAAYMRAKADADLDLMSASKAPTRRTSSRAFDETPHPELFIRLSKWREKVAAQEGVSPYEVIAVRSMMELTRSLPTSTATLKRIRGLGEVKIRRHGADLIALVEAYAREKQISTDMLDFLPAPKPSKPDTKRISLELFRAGKNIDEVAAERGFVRSTIEGHLAHWVGEGELKIHEVMEPEKVEELQAYYQDRESHSSTEARAHFGEKYGYGEIKLVLAHLRWENRLQ